MEPRWVCAASGLFLCLISPAPVHGQAAQAAALKTEGLYPRYASRGHKTVINVAVPSPMAVESAEITPAAGVTIAGIKGEGSGSEQNIGWWEVTLDVASNAAAGDRA